MKNFLKMLVQKTLLPFVYNIFRWQHIRGGLVIMADAHSDTRPPRMDAIYAELKRQGYLVKEMYADYQNMSYLGVLRASMNFMRWYTVANYVIISDNFLPVSACRKKDGTFVIQLWHGCGAFKKFGYDTPDDIPSSYKGNVFQNYDLVTVSGERAVSAFTSAMRQPAAVCRPVGVSTTDCYFQKSYLRACRERFDKSHPDAVGKKLLLWAPTFRGPASKPYLVGEDSFDRATACLGDDWYIITKKHPHMESKGYASSSPIPADELLPLVDLLITDYSSIIFNYLIFQKPMIFFAPDLAEYQCRRGFYLNYEQLPGTIAKDEGSLKDAILNISQWFDPVGLAAFYQKYMNGCDGKATKRIVAIMETKKYNDR